MSIFWNNNKAYWGKGSVLTIKHAGEREVLLQKQDRRATKLSLPPWNSELLTLISGRANKIFLC